MKYIITKSLGKYSILTEECWYAKEAYPTPAWVEHKECNVTKKTFDNLVKFSPSLAAQVLLKTIWQESC